MFGGVPLPFSAPSLFLEYLSALLTLQEIEFVPVYRVTYLLCHVPLSCQGRYVEVGVSVKYFIYLFCEISAQIVLGTRPQSVRFSGMIRILALTSLHRLSDCFMDFSAYQYSEFDHPRTGD